MFPLCWEVMPADQPRNIALYSSLGFLSRAYSLPDDEYKHNLKEQDLIAIQSQFVYLMWQQHGKWNLVYNVHLMLHLHIIRRKFGPFWKFSAFAFESMYSQLVRAFTCGSPNTLAQAFENIYLRLLASHACRKRVYIGPNTTDTRDDSLFYTWSAEEGYKFYKALTEYDELTGIEAYRISHLGHEDTYDWEAVGMGEWGPICDDKVIKVPAKEVKGKAIHVGRYVLSIGNGLLRESGRSVKSTEDI